ncbi:hypothetical protein SAMN02799630_00257 [Paenibacillus sp. UNCCL117]|uniref:hypothetical protein n=1 Tax=unclassified Paenibacillus TaxID=185978 RepID=UPI00088A1096|nr:MULTISPECIES: hypothetical protein [unclassified Paenibacillus]SDC46463.1 hypothetical protein SAMN04488602_102275 [Paenibacillus sp. cl123]SFW12298.1 hypothetical protein SAMN02799630_00257 [Paenibacillus sp. UNCCL117]
MSSRKWERMVRKNSKVAARRNQSGSTSSAVKATDGSVTFKGRSWLLPLLLIVIGIFCFVVFRRMPGQESMYWVTGSSYIVLALLMYWARRPLLKVGKTSLTSRRFGGDRVVEASKIQDITITKDTVIVTIRPKGNRWGFSKTFHRMPIEAMTEKLAEFASKNNVEFKQTV